MPSSSSSLNKSGWPAAVAGFTLSGLSRRRWRAGLAQAQQQHEDEHPALGARGQARAISFNTDPSGAMIRIISGIWPAACVEQLRQGS